MGTLAATISKQITSNLYPRLLIISPGLKINPLAADREEIVTHNFHLSNLDFRDKLTGLPLVYDFILEKAIVNFVIPDLFISSKTITQEYITVKEIQLNTIEGNDPTQIGCTINYKVYGVTNVIEIRYVLFEDVLNLFGGYWSTFEMLGLIMSYAYKEYFYRAVLLNFTFKFHENLEGSNLNFQNMEPNILIKQDNEKGLVNLNEVRDIGEKEDKDGGYENIELHNINLADLPSKQQSDLLTKHFNKKAIMEHATLEVKNGIGIIT